MPHQPQHPIPEEFAGNEWLVDELYEQYVADKNSVDKSWWPVLESYRSHVSGGSAAPAEGVTPPAASASPAAPAEAVATPPTAKTESQQVAEASGAESRTMTQPIARTGKASSVNR